VGIGLRGQGLPGCSGLIKPDQGRSSLTKSVAEK
jgi:hypothetical protein